MCGIVGVVYKAGRRVSRSDLEAMNAVQRHRGPDDEGIYLEGNIGLGHTRLSILDLSDAAHQPMVRSGNVLVYNGEVYNFQTLRKELEREMPFLSRSDTEVILAAYVQTGDIAFVEKLNGMFAFGLLDTTKKQLFLVRDRFGIKPLYVYEDDEKILFASEIKAILAFPGVSVTLDSEALAEYFHFHYIRHPATPYKEIRKVSPATICTLDLTTFAWKRHRYYTLPDDCADDAKHRIESNDIESLLEDSVSMRLVSDVEVGVFLSGGVDSGLVTAMAAKHTVRPIQTFSMSFEGVSRYFDESAYAKEISRQYDTRHHVFRMNFENMYDHLERLVSYMDEPIADSSVLLNDMISRETKRHVTVALSGVGGDEVFGGYNRHRAFVVAGYLKYMPWLRQIQKLEYIGTRRNGYMGNALRHLVDLARSLDSNPDRAYATMISYADDRRFMLGIDSFRLENVLRYDISYYLGDNLLNFIDTTSMRYGLEVRTPLLDYRLVNAAFCLDSRLKTTLLGTKVILKRIAEKYLPYHTIYRRKQGFAAPVEIWLRQIGKEKVVSMIDFPAIDRFFASAYIRKEISLFFEKRIDRSMQIYAAIVFSMWMQKTRRYL